MALVEIWPSLINPAVADEIRRLEAMGQVAIKDAVRLLAAAMAGIDPARLRRMLDLQAPEEGWILGQGAMRQS